MAINKETPLTLQTEKDKSVSVMTYGIVKKGEGPEIIYLKSGDKNKELFPALTKFKDGAN